MTVKAGIDGIGVYFPDYCVKAETLAPVRGEDPEKIIRGLGIRSFAVPTPFEDAVTMAANAADDLLADRPEVVGQIRRVVVATESALDSSKPLAAYLHGMLGLHEECEAYDIKFACVAGMYALFDALRFVQATKRYALVLVSDISMYGPQAGSAEFTQGAGAVALLVGPNPGILELDPDASGTFTRDENDFYRPFGRREAVVQGRYSVDCYLRALSSVESYKSVMGMDNLFDGPDGPLETVIFHSPYPKLPLKALRRLFESNPVAEERKRELELRLHEALRGARALGNTYTASVFFSLAGILQSRAGTLSGTNLGIYTYGSGSGSKFTVGRFCDPLPALSRLRTHCTRLDNLVSLSVEEYEEMFLQGRLPFESLPVPYRGWKLDKEDDTGYRWYTKER